MLESQQASGLSLEFSRGTCRVSIFFCSSVFLSGLVLSKDKPDACLTDTVVLYDIYTLVPIGRKRFGVVLSVECSLGRPRFVETGPYQERRANGTVHRCSFFRRALLS